MPSSLSGADGDDRIYLSNGGFALGNAGDDLLVGPETAKATRLFGGAGNDTLVGRKALGGTLLGPAIKDIDGNLCDGVGFYPGSGNDTIYGSSNRDCLNTVNITGTAYFYGNAGDDMAIIGTGGAFGMAGDDYLNVRNGPAVGGPGTDIVISGSGQAQQ